jgi:hypothetical protein
MRKSEAVNRRENAPEQRTLYQHRDVVMTMVEELCGSIAPQGADWYTKEVERRLISIHHRLSYALNIKPDDNGPDED